MEADLLIFNLHKIRLIKISFRHLIIFNLYYRTFGKVTDVVEGHEYEFRIVAVNKAGPSPPSDPSKSVVAKPRFCKYLQ